MTIEELIEAFLSARAERTASAYRSDLDEFARLRGKPSPQAVADLLARGPNECRLELLAFVAPLRKVGRAESTIRRRIHTLLSLCRMAHDLGVIDWEVELTDWGPAALAEVEDDPTAVAYLLPRHPAEIDRLDLQHYALAEALGTNYLAHVGRPKRVLDAGAGTGQWGIDLLAQHPTALVVGYDLVAPKPGTPARYHAVRGNLLQGLPFTEEAFDFVHQRLLFAGIPVEEWPRVVGDLVRTCRPGGWVELVEGASRLQPGGPATERLMELTGQLWGTRGLDNQSLVFESLDGYLRDAGLRDVKRQEVKIPVGEWGGRLGSMWAADVRSLSLRMTSLFTTKLGVASEDFLALMNAATQEWEELHATYGMAVAWGWKP